MAVQKSRKTPSTRGMRRSHDSLRAGALATDMETGEIHLRHHMSDSGFYRGKQWIVKSNDQVDADDEHDED